MKSIASCTSKKRLFHDLGELAEVSYGLNSVDVVDALIAREGLGPTGVGQGIALPHARMAGAEGVFGLFLRLEKPLDFDAVDRQPGDLVFALIAPEDAGVAHLKELAQLSPTFRDKSVCNTLHTILTELEASQAA